MKRGSTTMSSLRVVAVACLCVAVAAAVQFGPYFVKMLKVYQEGPSIGAALNSDAMQIDRKLHGTTYTFLYEDRDEAGRVRYHFVSNSGGNIPLVITCEFHWFDSWGFLEFYPAGWNYTRTNLEEWVDAYDAWGSGQEYGIPIR